MIIRFEGDSLPMTVGSLRALLQGHPNNTPIYAARDNEHTHAHITSLRQDHKQPTLALCVGVFHPDQTETDGQPIVDGASLWPRIDGSS